jgi:hypothetical protein
MEGDRAMVRTVKTDKTAAERMARKRQRDREERGIVGVLVKVHETRKADIKAVAATMLEPKEEQGK